MELGPHSDDETMEIQIRMRQHMKLGRITVPPKVTLLRYTYDPVAKRGRQAIIGSVDFWADDLPGEINETVTADERSDFHDFVANRQWQEKKALERFHLDRLVEALAFASKALDRGERPAYPDKFWSAIDVFTASLERAGYIRSKRERGRPRKDKVTTADLLLDPSLDTVDYWQMRADEAALAALPNFIPADQMPAGKPKRVWPIYPDGDLVAHATGLAFGTAGPDEPAP